MVSSKTVLLGFASSTLAALLPRQVTQCTFSLNALGLDGNPNVRQDTIGQPKIGGTFPLGSYILEEKSLRDSQNHTCIISPNTSQLQCTQGVPQNTVFTFSDDFHILHGDSAKWLACPSAGPGDDGSQVIYADTKEDKTGCSEIELLAGGFGCAVLGRPDPTTSSTIAARTEPASYASTAPSTVNTSTPAVSCPKDIGEGTFQFPHLIVPTSLTNTEKAGGNSYTAYISASNTTLLNFDIPAVEPYLGTCSLVFQFPYGSDLNPDTPKFYFSGLEQQEGSNGGLDFALLDGVASESTTFASTPKVATDYGKTKIIPGTNYTIASFPCQSGKTVSYSVSSAGGVELDYFQDSRASAIGLFVVPCA